MAQTPVTIGGASGTNIPDANYSEGSARDVSAPSAGDGFPWLAAWVNQWEAFTQRMMTDAGLAYNGAVDTEIASQFFDAATTLFGGGFSLLQSVAPTGVTSFQVTGVPATAKEILIVMTDVDYTVASRTRITVLVGGTPVTTGYKDNTVLYFGGATPSVGTGGNTKFETIRTSNVVGSSVHDGSGTLAKNNTLDKWVYNFTGQVVETPVGLTTSHEETIGSTGTLAGALDGLEFTSLSGNFDGGTFSVYTR